MSDNDNSRKEQPSPSRYDREDGGKQHRKKKRGGSPVLRAIIVILVIVIVVLIGLMAMMMHRNASLGQTQQSVSQIGTGLLGTIRQELSSLTGGSGTGSSADNGDAGSNTQSDVGNGSAEADNSDVTGTGNSSGQAAAGGSTVSADNSGTSTAALENSSAEGNASNAVAGTSGTAASEVTTASDVTAASDFAAASEAETLQETETQTAAPAHENELNQAALLAAGYDYDGAIALLEGVDNYQSDPQITEAISSYEETKASCTAVDVYSVPHIFYHSLINDTDRAFNVEVLGQAAVDGFNAWMTTVDEFDKITQQLYDNGYVYVRLRDLVVETKNADGSSHFEANTNLMLPPGKKAIVLSVDDLSYYHSYAAAGYPDKLVLDENGNVKCQYTDSSGNTTIGDYDVVPRLNTFLAEHPDGSYHGARGLIAMTGYDGCFGYRTDQDYEERKALMDDQAAWLAEHPDFNRQDEIDQATIIANALKDEGWEFASHTWGHLSVTQYDVDKLKTDNERWVANVQNIVGPVDTIIFAHGNDIGDWTNYTEDNPKYAYYHSAGYNFFCNVDGSVPSWVQITSDYVRQGRIDLDGYMLYQASTGQTHVLDDLFDASSVFDSRRPTPVIANGQS